MGDGASRTETVYLNGSWLPASDALVPATDRGFLFGDGVYEVSPVYGGVPFLPESRRARLRRGLDALRIRCEPSLLDEVQAELLERNDLTTVPMAAVYFQVTRGAPAIRAHHFPTEDTSPTVFAYARAFERPGAEAWAEGARAVTVADTRWSRADLKTLQLLPNVLAQEAARRDGARDAIFVRDGLALEGAHNNLFVVRDGKVRTHPASNQILPGITRELVLELARTGGYEVVEAPTTLDALRTASEVFLTGSTTEIRPIVAVDGVSIGDGTVGPVSRSLYAAFLARVARECGVRLEEPAPP